MEDPGEYATLWLCHLKIFLSVNVDSSMSYYAIVLTSIWSVITIVYNTFGSVYEMPFPIQQSSQKGKCGTSLK